MSGANNQLPKIEIPKVENLKPEETQHIINKYYAFMLLVFKMRGEQAAYFKSHNGMHLDAAKKLEKQVDKAIKEEGDLIVKHQTSLF